MTLSDKLTLSYWLDWVVPKFTTRWYVVEPNVTVNGKSGWFPDVNRPLDFEETPSRYVVKLRTFAWAILIYTFDPKESEGEIVRWSEFVQLHAKDVPEHLKGYDNW